MEGTILRHFTRIFPFVVTLNFHSILKEQILILQHHLFNNFIVNSYVVDYLPYGIE